MSDSTSVPAGWYADSSDPTGQRKRWWDGQQWTDHFHPPLTTLPAPRAAAVALSGAVSEVAPAGGSQSDVTRSVASDSTNRPWYKRKAIIIPVAAVAGIFLISGIANAANRHDRPSSVAAATVAQEDSSAPPSRPATPRPSSTPAPIFTVPNVVGSTIGEARASVEAQGLTLQSDASWGDDWTVLTQTPTSGRSGVAVAVVVTAQAPEPVLTLGQENAVESAQSYLRFTGFSRLGLFDQLSSQFGEGFTPEDAEFALAYVEQRGLVDWNAEAVESAQSYLDFTSFSRDGLYDQLTSEYGEQFTPDQANYALAAVGY